MLDKSTKKMYKFLLLKNDQNDATSYYISIIISALEISGKNFKVIHSTNEIEKDDIVITIQAKAFFYVWLKNRKQRIIAKIFLSFFIKILQYINLMSL